MINKNVDQMKISNYQKTHNKIVEFTNMINDNEKNLIELMKKNEPKHSEDVNGLIGQYDMEVGAVQKEVMNSLEMHTNEMKRIEQSFSVDINSKSVEITKNQNNLMTKMYGMEKKTNEDFEETLDIMKDVLNELNSFN